MELQVSGGLTLTDWINWGMSTEQAGVSQDNSTYLRVKEINGQLADQ
jgi:hypothetical protein